ncbi:hypothetical protein SAMN04487843_108199 [Methylobacterium sp. ap11]|uniref:hypothetical protein n=1 Tax=Methylobacterium sp. ap11 TaxID=1761799 RepID=UPI0008AAB6E0|nr:hypothetical protein [Methylobacterium sp. ap11]SEP21281.1 hypothetical protein SAMN04487843_108199 [Methylobacterium sp. ap11]
MTAGIRSSNLPLGVLVEVLGHAEAGNGQRNLVRAPLDALADAVRGIVVNDPSGVANLRVALEALSNVVNGKASQGDLATVQQALAPLQQAVGGKADASAVADLLARILRIYAGLYPAERPGDNPVAFTASRAGGDPDTLSPLDTVVYPIRVVGDGFGVEISGSREVWERTLHAAETTRLWRGRWRYVRTAPSQDPSGDSIVALVQWYGADRSLIGSPVQVDAATPAVGTPREFSAFIGISGVTGVTVSRPAGAVYFRVGLKSYGVEGRTVLTDLHAGDISDIDDAIRRLVPPDAFPALSARIDEVVGDLADEVAAARQAESALGVRIDNIDDRGDQFTQAIGNLQTEIFDGRGGYANLATRLAASDRAGGLTAGASFLARVSAQAQAFNGATLSPYQSKPDFSVSIPAGSSGAGTYVAAMRSFTPDEIAALVGQVVVFRTVYGVSRPDFLAEKPLDLAVRVLRSGTYVNDGIVLSTRQDGLFITRVCAYRVTAADSLIGPIIQIGSTSTANAHVIRIESVNFRVETTDNDSRTGSDILLDRRFAEATPGIGPVYDVLVPAPQLRAGAAGYVEGQPPGFGLRIPAGQTGSGSVLSFGVKVDPADAPLLAGRTVLVTATFTSTTARSITIGMVTTPMADAPRQVAVTPLADAQVSSFRRVVQFEATLTGDEIVLAPYYGLLSDAVASAEEHLILTQLTARIVASPSDAMTLAEENALIAARRLAARAAVTIPAAADTYAVTLKVRQDGTGDFASVKAAAFSIRDSSAFKRYAIDFIGTYDEISIRLPRFTDLVGHGIARSWLRGYQAPSTPIDQVNNNSTVDVDVTCRFLDCRITCQNMRYPVHSETNGAVPDIDERVFDCEFENFGNDEVRAYVSSQGGDPNTVFATLSPWGYGCSSGQTLLIERCTMRGENGFYVHDNKDFTRPSKHVVRNSKLIGRSEYGTGIIVQPLGGGEPLVVELIGNQISGHFLLSPFPWLTADPALQLADRAFQLRVSGYGNTPFAYDCQDLGARALRIESASTAAGTAIAVSGSAVAAIFGAVTVDRSGGGLRGAVYGAWEVAGIPFGLSQTAGLTTLGQRLGDCRTTPKTLVVQVNGGTSYTVTFSADHRAQSNATVLGIINGALGSAATASLMDVTERWRPAMRDEEIEVYNGGATAIRRKRAVAYASSQRTCRPMSADDPASVFAGIAYEDIPPGMTGRVKKGGFVRVGTDLVRGDNAGFIRGDSFGLDANGLWIKNATTPLLWAVNELDVALPDLGRIAALRDQLNSSF